MFRDYRTPYECKRRLNFILIEVHRKPFRLVGRLPCMLCDRVYPLGIRTLMLGVGRVTSNARQSSSRLALLCHDLCRTQLAVSGITINSFATAAADSLRFN